LESISEMIINEQPYSYLAGGVDSGPPQGAFGEYLWQNLFSMELPALLAFLVAGLGTAMLYWFLAGQESE